MQKIIISCEHASNAIPQAYQYLFAQDEAVLQTHLAYDIGAQIIARKLADEFADYYLEGTISRLLIEYNRSLHHRSLFSKYSKNLNQQDKKNLTQAFYQTYRDQIEKHIEKYITQGNQVLHLSIHSFTPVLDGQIRNADLGLLYDPAHAEEAKWCLALKKQFQIQEPTCKVRMNYPYRGKYDGFTRALRQMFPPEKYSGIEIEFNQKHLLTEQSCLVWTNKFSKVFKNLI